MPRNPIQLKPAVGVNKAQATELLLQALETDLGGVHIYESAILLARDPGLRAEWESCLESMRNHVLVLRGVFAQLGLDTQAESPGRSVVRDVAGALVQAMAAARHDGTEEAAQRVAAECVILAETKDHFNWGLIGELAKSLKGTEATLLAAAHAEVEREEDEHLSHAVGWARELWLKSLGIPAALPPPEERKQVQSAEGARRAKDGRALFLKKQA